MRRSPSVPLSYGGSLFSNGLPLSQCHLNSQYGKRGSSERISYSQTAGVCPVGYGDQTAKWCSLEQQEQDL
ncbi:hypothetical protein KIL84_002288 [Mauremys mutica]|uniref:Uncharacterized protein n=1 Tax=Mauremys mutica TaxID=74926 RepID=A0A9D3X282_9SAUR|nr:hypothetical protein KIL84_002288 [Mauremys mutica]